MTLSNLWLFLHFFFAFAFVGSLIVAEWCGRAARVSNDWKTRALLFDLVKRASAAAGLGPLVLLGVFGNLRALAVGLPMATPWLRAANVLWLLAVILMVTANLPGAARLATLAAGAGDGNVPAGWAAAHRRWRIASAGQTVLYLALLLVMVYGPRR